MVFVLHSHCKTKVASTFKFFIYFLGTLQNISNLICPFLSVQLCPTQFCILIPSVVRFLIGTSGMIPVLSSHVSPKQRSQKCVKEG